MSKEEEKKLLELFNPKNKKILDVGCGDGRYATLFAQLCQEYVGIDISSDLSNVIYGIINIKTFLFMKQILFPINHL